jgi:AcrR family transcriptional regulator
VLLPRGESALPRDRLAAVQEDRLRRAFIAVCASEGYGGTAVAKVVAEARTSRATFYEHFGSREDCLLSAYRATTLQWDEQLALAGRGAASRHRLEVVLEALLRVIAEDVARARLVLVETLAAGDRARHEREVMVRRGSAFLMRLLAHAERPPHAPALALFGGLYWAIATRVLHDEGDQLLRISAPLLAWIHSYDPPASTPQSTVDWDRLGGCSPGSSRPPTQTTPERSAGAEDAYERKGVQAERIVSAVAGLSVEKGYAGMTISDIVARAGIARETFYACFAGKAEAYRATQESALNKVIAMSATAFVSEGGWRARVWRGLEALLEFASTHPALAAVDLIESFAAGPDAVNRSIQNRLAFTLFLEEGYRQRPEAERLPRICSEAISGAIFELMRREVVAGRAEHLTKLLPRACYVALAPFIGPMEARRFIESRRTGEPHSGQT